RQALAGLPRLPQPEGLPRVFDLRRQRRWKGPALNWPRKTKLSPSQKRELAQRVGQIRAYMRTPHPKTADPVELGGEAQRTDKAPDLRRRAFGVERVWELMAGLGVRHSDLERAFPDEFCPSAVSAADFQVRRRRSKTQVIDFIKEPYQGSDGN